MEPGVKTQQSSKCKNNLGSNRCHNSYLNYLKTLVTYSNGRIKFDESKTLFFRLGHNPIYSHDLLVYMGQSEGQLNFRDLARPQDVSIRNSFFFPKLMEVVQNSFKQMRQIGWIIIYEHKWGFLLDLQSLEPVYNGEITSYWQKILKYDFFIDEFIKYAYYNYEEIEKQEECNVIPSTEFDARIRPAFCPLFEKLYFHQAQEVGWMFHLENDPNLKIPVHMESVPFLDTGYFINSKNRQLSLDTKPLGFQIPVPSGILASQIGSGKTVSIIGLLTIGSQFADKHQVTTQVKVLEEGKNKHKKGEDEYEEVKTNSVNLQKPKIDFIQEEDFELDPFFADNDYENNLDDLKGILKDRYEPSLIIVTRNILHQWKGEFKKFAPYLRVFVMEKVDDILNLKFTEYKGQDEAILNGYDIILTHRVVIDQGADYFKIVSPLLFKVKFRRIVIDEIHELITAWNKQHKKKDNNFKGNDVSEYINMDQFYSCLSSFKRHFTWGMTGTPNNLNFYNETEPLFKLLQLQNQFSQLNVYKEFKAKFLQSHVRANPCSVFLPPLIKNCVNVNFGHVQNLMYQAKLSHSIDPDDARIACSQLLPQYDIMDMEGVLPISIQHAMAIIYQKHQNEIDSITYKLEKQQDNKVLQNRLKALQEENNFYLEMIELLKQQEFVCPVCMCEVEVKSLVVTNCIHSVCLDCYTGLTKSFAHPMCPLCRNYVLDNQLIVHPRYEENKNNKLKMIVEAINKVPEGEKIIIFTQFHTLVEKLEGAFTYLGIKYIVLKGKPSEISISLRKFEEIRDIKIILMSVEQAASGINITVANHVFFAHPIFGTSFEKAALTYQQCIGRAYRIGQKKTVNVKLFITNKSLEESMTETFLKSDKIIM